MVFDKTQPTNTTKLRNLGVVVRPNWDAIESADSTFIPEALNLADRTAGVIVPTDPTAIADTMIFYSKQDGSGNAQIFAIDPSSNIYQLTGNSYTETVNGGTAAGTLYKVVRYVGDGTRIVEYSGTTAAFSGNATVTFPEALTVVYTATVSANDTNVQKMSVVKGTAGLTIYTENSVTVNWFAQGRIT